MEEVIRVPEERIGVLIGLKGIVRKTISQKTKTKIEIDSQYGDVTLRGEGEDFFKAADIVKAIGRGFSPERAYKLFEDYYMLKVIDITGYSGKSSSTQKAKRGRVIGREGLARMEIEKKTHSMISVQGKTIAIIARPEDIEQAAEAIEMLLGGAKHETMERYLEKESTEQFEL